MTDAPPEPLRDDLRAALLNATRGEAGAPAAAARSIRARLGHDLLATSVALATLESAARSTWLTSLLRGALRASKAWALKATLAGAAAYGAGYATHAALAPEREPRVVYIERPSLHAPPTETAPPAAGPPPEVAPVTSPEALALAPGPRPRPEAVARVPAPSRDASLAAERLHLEMARAALARGDVQATLAAVERYQVGFPGGQLREEAEVVAIQALARAGRTSDARARAALYRARYPNGFFGSAVADAIR